MISAMAMLMIMIVWVKAVMSTAVRKAIRTKMMLLMVIMILITAIIITIKKINDKTVPSDS